MVNADLARVRRYRKNNSAGVDYNKKLTVNQYLLLIKGHRLTELIEVLEQRRLSGDVAIFIIGNIQSLGMA